MAELSRTTFGGVDWATADHSVCVVDGDGQIIDEFIVAHTLDGLGDLCRRLTKNRVGRIAIERPDGPVVDALMQAGFEVVVVVSRSVKAFRQRYSLSGSKSDRSDAFVLADCLRSDGHRWSSLQPDSPDTVTIRSHVRARRDLVRAKVATTNQLRDHLKICFPAAVGLFSDLDGVMSRKFLRRFPSENKASWLTEKRLSNWLKTARYNNKKSVENLFAHIQNAPTGITGPEATARAAVTAAYLAVIDTLIQQIKELDVHLKDLLDAHPDAHIFRSLPRCGTIRAATLLAEIGNCRARFPDPNSLACLAGVTPSTRASGRHRSVTFRRAVNTNLRNALCSFAGDSHNGNEWAAHRYQQLRADGKRHPHAERIMARTWTQIIWRCWQDNQPYNPARHQALQTLKKQKLLT